VDFSKAYGFPLGFSFRREAFGGILYHYEGVKPDPRVTFVDNPFLLDLLERVNEAPLEALIAGVTRHFALAPGDEAAIRAFFTTLAERGALVERSQLCGACAMPAPSEAR
jgi:putative mycofactocin binding protein MftB